MDNFAATIFVQVFWYTYVCCVFKYILSSRIGRTEGMHTLSFSMRCKNSYQNHTNLHAYQQGMKIPLAVHFCQSLVLTACIVS